MESQLFRDITQDVTICMMQVGILKEPMMQFLNNDLGILNRQHEMHTTDAEFISLKNTEYDTYAFVCGMHALGTGLYVCTKQVDNEKSIQEWGLAEVQSIFDEFASTDAYELALNRMGWLPTGNNKKVLDHVILTGLKSAKENSEKDVLSDNELKAYMQVMFNVGVTIAYCKPIPQKKIEAETQNDGKNTPDEAPKTENKPETKKKRYAVKLTNKPKGETSLKKEAEEKSVEEVKHKEKNKSKSFTLVCILAAVFFLFSVALTVFVIKNGTENSKSKETISELKSKLEETERQLHNKEKTIEADEKVIKNASEKIRKLEKENKYYINAAWVDKSGYIHWYYDCSEIDTESARIVDDRYFNNEICPMCQKTFKANLEYQAKHGN